VDIKWSSMAISRSSSWLWPSRWDSRSEAKYLERASQ
jgi:hypothetical protein